MYERRNKTMTFKEIAKLLETNIQTIPNLIAILKKGFEEAEAGSDVEVTQIQSSGTKIASIAVGEESTDIYAPDPSIAYVAAETKIGTFLGSDLYRQVITIEEVTLTSNQEATLTTITTNLKIRKILATANEGTTRYQIPDMGIRIAYKEESGNIDIRSATGATWNLEEIIIIIEYEKPTE